MFNDIGVWLSVRQRPRENHYITYLMLLIHQFQSDREPPPVMHCVAYFNFEDTSEDLGKVQLPRCITENSATTIQHWELGRISFSSHTFSQFWQFQNTAFDHLHASFLLLSIPVGLHTQWIEPENLSQLSCGHPNNSDHMCYIKTE